MLKYAYDIETLANLFTVTFVNVEDDTDTHVFYIGLGKYDWSDIKDFLNNSILLIGYNSISYDDPMLRFIIEYKGDPKKINQELYLLSGMLVNDSYRRDKQILSLRYPRKVYPWQTMDLMALMGFDKLGISLKQVSINLKWHKIQDMPIEHTATIKENDLLLILEYNKNDVLITKKLYEAIDEIRQLRRDLSKLYDVDLTSASDSKMANLILEHIYSKELKINISSIKNKRTRRDKVFLGECVAPFVDFKTPELNEVLDRITSTYVHREKYYRYSEDVFFAGCKFKLGIGGLHSVDEAGKFETDNEYTIQDMDVASYYPNLIINNNFYPKHLGKDFIKVLKKITKERLEAKKSGDKVKADGLKITVNSIFGKLGSETFWLLDAKQMLSTTVSGQMGLLMLIEDLYLNGIEILSCNTDGIVCKIAKDKEDVYYKVAKDWEERTNLELEYTPYRKYVRRDVNSYITEKLHPKNEKDRYKEKGAFLTGIDLKKSYVMPIVSKALFEYFMKDIPIRDTLEKSKDIMEFCISQKTGDNFSVELHTTEGAESLQKTNRFFISKTGGAFIKRDYRSGKLTGLYVGNLVTILNDYDETKRFDEYNVNLAFYEKEAMKIVDKIEPKQLHLFDLSSLGRSSKTKAEVSQITNEQIALKPTINELNKLGKNQLAIKLETMATKNQTVRTINPRYVYVLNYDVKNSIAELYCLGRGTTQHIKVDTKLYKDNPIEKGQLMFCTEFKKSGRSGTYTLTDYRITTKFEPERARLMD